MTGARGVGRSWAGEEGPETDEASGAGGDQVSRGPCSPHRGFQGVLKELSLEKPHWEASREGGL